MQSQDSDGSRVAREALLGPWEKPVLYAKHMAKHQLGVDRALLRRGRHVLLVRCGAGAAAPAGGARGWVGGLRTRGYQCSVAPPLLSR
jgi:hypothetical protein